MSDGSLKFGTMLNCMDGRTQEPVAKWMKEHCGVKVIDSPNPAGPTNLITKGEKAIVEHYKNEVLISLNGHGSKDLVIVAHQECAANPISDEEQIAQLKEACDIVKECWELPEGTKIMGLWLTKRTDIDWDINCLVTKQIPVTQEVTYA